RRIAVLKRSPLPSLLETLIVLTLVATMPEELNAAFPGSNGLIAFQTDLDHVAPVPGQGTFEIHVMNPDGSAPARLTTRGGSDPAWPPDGTRIAFVSQRDGNFEIYVMDADGSNQTRLTNRPTATDLMPAWSPDGARIAFASYVCCPSGANYDIWVMNAD